MNRYHRTAAGVFHALTAEDGPVEKNDQRTAEALALIGQFYAQLSISRSLERIANAIEIIADVAEGEASTATALNLHVVGTPRKEIPVMPPIAPVSVDTNSDVEFTVTPKDAGGNAVPDTVTWSSSNEAVVKMVPAADGLSARGVTVAPGSATVTATDGTNTDTDDVTVTAGAATSLGMASSVVPKVPA